MNDERKNKIAIQKIIFYCEEIDKILKLHDNDFNYFLTNSEIQYACSMCIVQIGEMTALISDDVKNKYNQIPWRLIKGARNFYVHDYGEVNLQEFWDTLTISIPELKDKLQKIIENLA